MSGRLETLSAGEINQIEQSRARAARRAERRELLTEIVVASLVLAASAVCWVTLGSGRGALALAGWLTVLCAVLVRIVFPVGEGSTHPVQLAVVPMLVLLPPGEIPLAIAAAHVLAIVPEVARRRVRAYRLLLSVADSGFAVAPSLVLALMAPRSFSEHAEAVAVAVAAMIASDFALSCLRMRIGIGISPRQELRGFAWVYLADLCLAPLGFLAGVAAERHPVVIAGLLPLAGLLALFASERQGRIENALELQRVAQEGQERLQSILQNSSDLIAILGADWSIRTVTGSIEPIFGSHGREVEGERLLDWVHPDDLAQVSAFLTAITGKATGEQQEAEWRMRYADGSYRHIAAVATNLLDNVRVRGIVVTARDVNERKAFEEQLRHRAFHDALTGLANRALFFDRIEHALSRTSRHADAVAVLFVDLDDFKPVNDRRGHRAGDQLLEEVARRVRSCLRSADTAARLGGDEFGILLEGVGGEQDAERTARRVLEALAEPFELDGAPLRVSASIGIAASAPGDRGVEELLRKADLAMYEAKRTGKGRAERYRPELETTSPHGTRTAWFRRNDEEREEIQGILDDPDALAMVCQPLMDLRTGRVAGYESLARFDRTPRRPPNEWFAQAHRCGLGYALEAKAIAAALALPGRPANTYLSINLSPSSLVADEVLAALPGDLSGLVVEVTENELVSGDPAIDAALAALRRRGARLAVDDTGAGYAGLTHVMRLSPDVIKLDRAITTGVDSDPVKAALIASFVRYARDIDASVCAEGVETLEELKCLADLDVAYGQGWVIARPAPPWASVAKEASATCVLSFESSLSDTGALPGRADHDRRLELLARRLADAATAQELYACLSPIAEELRADDVRIVNEVKSSSRAAGREPAAAGGDPNAYASHLALPIRRGGRTVGRLEAYCRQERPWSRFEIGRARMLAHQVGAALERTGELS